MKYQWSNLLNRKAMAPPPEERLAEPAQILEARESDGKVRLRVMMSKEFYDYLYGFLEEKGYLSFNQDKIVSSLLLKYGLSKETRAALEENKRETDKLMSSYASMRFQTYEYYTRNSSIVCGLHNLLNENKALKQELKKKGFEQLVTEDEWDNWDDNFIEGIYQRYVFCK